MKPSKKTLPQIIITDEFKAAVKGIDLNLGRTEEAEVTELEALEELYSKKYITKTQYERKKKALHN